MHALFHLKHNRTLLEQGKSKVIADWIAYEGPQTILNHHKIDKNIFVEKYANNVFDYFMGVIKGFVEIGNCPVIVELLIYLKDKNISAKELFIICSHFKLAMVAYTYEISINTKELFEEITYVFDKNFSRVLEIYSQTIYEKDIEISKNVELLEQYIYALNESALVSKTDSNGFITHVNKKFIQLCGYQESELIGRSHSIMRHSDMSKAFFKKLWSTIECNKIFVGIIKNRSKNGGYFYIDTTIIPIVDPFSGNKEYMAIGYEVTKLIDAKQKAIDADRAKDYFLSNMSHEIRTPLNAILGFVSLLWGEDLSFKHKNYLEIIHNSGENLLHIINDLLDFSKLRSGEFTLEPKIFNLEEALSRIMELFVASASQKQIAILSFIDPTIPSAIFADELRLGQIISNFLSNAIKFTHVRGVVEINAHYTHESIEISVEDSGVGIEKKDIKKIFEAFTQAQNSVTKRSGGTGLGLSICKQLAEKMGGRIEVKSTLGMGSKFTLTLPVEVINTAMRHLDCQMLQEKNIAFLINEKTENRKLEIFEKYFTQMGLQLVSLEEIQEKEYDLLYFMDSDIDDVTRVAIIKNNKPAIAIMEYMDDSYASVSNVTNLCFPIYLSKLRARSLEALGLSEAYNKKIATLQESKKFNGHILIAEDNEANQELMKIVLAKYAISYDIASNGLEAFEMFKENSYDLVLMDDQMPLQNGLEAAQEIRNYEKKNQCKLTPIAMLTANVIKGAREKSLECGFDDFLGKPLVIKELELVFEKFLSSQSKEVPKKFDLSSLQDALQLDYEQLEMLLQIYIKKMDAMVPELKEEIQKKAYGNIAKLAHSIKGSSANFRLETLQNLAHEMEKSAKEENSYYDYEDCVGNIEKFYTEMKN